MLRAVKGKANGSGRTYTSRYRGVHQTFPTKRWEAQFRRNGKPTSLGCFDHEEEAARAYDKMMLWCELHNAAGVKSGITNFDPPEYEKDIAWLQSVSQDELIETLRSEGRRQAAHRMLRQKREGGGGDATTEDFDDPPAPSGGGGGFGGGGGAQAVSSGPLSLQPSDPGQQLAQGGLLLGLPPRPPQQAVHQQHPHQQAAMDPSVPLIVPNVVRTAGTAGPAAAAAASGLGQLAPMPSMPLLPSLQALSQSGGGAQGAGPAAQLGLGTAAAEGLVGQQPAAVASMSALAQALGFGSPARGAGDGLALDQEREVTTPPAQPLPEEPSTALGGSSADWSAYTPGAAAAVAALTSQEFLMEDMADVTGATC